MTAELCLCLKLLEVRVPQLIDIREEAILKCKFDLEGDELYSVKWYKEELEFYRYMPDNNPKILTFPVDGVHVLESKSNVTVIALSPLDYTTSGVYRCEVSSERPHFKTVYKSQNMSVLGLPKTGPIIEGVKETYFLGDYITGNCTSSPSNPPAQIHWFINDKKAEDWLLEYYNPSKKKEKYNLESRVLGLRFQIDINHYQGKSQTLSLTCQSSVGGKTKTQRINVNLLRMMTNQKFAQEQINSGGNAFGRNLKKLFSLLFIASFMILI
ncbi:beat protein, putative [Pediculus humanus corporis]|uniref:Beat protein, putative n=1 Tax=Pediculus humanus subsp. corporis TaxID=121224 RepID=E0VIG5_PEDHC|nr:beat protein, putative [Pediculus humanus corporis]EEB13171.1 beat protein, putative [Pediculus humanus corporis]